METHTHTEVIRATPEQCFQTLVSFERYPEWFSRIQTTTVQSSDPQQGTWSVAYELDAIIKTIRYTLEYTSSRPSLLEWMMSTGDLRAIVGSYRLEELEPGITEATCSQGLDIGLWVPSIVRSGFERGALSDSVQELKRAVEAAVGSASDG